MVGKNNPVEVGSLITPQDIQAYFKENPLEPSTAVASFPLNQTNETKWQTISNNSLKRNEAADPLSLSSSIPVAGRPGYKDVMGAMVSFGKGREMDADDIENFEELKRKFLENTANPAAAAALINYYGDDLTFVRDSMFAEHSFLCWQLISSACNLAYLEANSPYMQGLVSMSYPVSSWQKDAVATSWANSAALILDDIESILDTGDDYSKEYVYMHVNRKWWGYIRKNEQVQKYAATLAQNLLNTQSPPTLEAVNATFSEYFKQPIQVVIVDEKVTRASRNDVHTTSNPFADGVAVFSTQAQLGHTDWKGIPVIDSRETAEGFFVVGNYTQIDPNYSKIYAKGRCFPVVDTYLDNFYLKIDAVNW